MFWGLDECCRGNSSLLSGWFRCAISYFSYKRIRMFRWNCDVCIFIVRKIHHLHLILKMCFSTMCILVEFDKRKIKRKHKKVSGVKKDKLYQQLNRKLYNVVEPGELYKRHPDLSVILQWPHCGLSTFGCERNWGQRWRIFAWCMFIDVLADQLWPSQAALYLVA